MLQISHINSILRQFVIFWPYSKDERINTFSTFDMPEDLFQDNLNKTYQDYVNGDFWSREWVYGGADVSKLVKQYGVMAVENKEVFLDVNDENFAIYPAMINILQKNEGGKNQRTVEQIDLSNYRAFKRLVTLLNKTWLYKVVNKGETVYTWLLEDAVESLTEGYESVYNTGVYLLNYIDNRDQLVVSKTEWGIDGVRSAMMELRFRVCEPENIVVETDVPASVKKEVLNVG